MFRCIGPEAGAPADGLLACLGAPISPYEEVVRDEVAREVLHAHYVGKIMAGDFRCWTAPEAVAERAFEAAEQFLAARRIARAQDELARGMKLKPEAGPAVDAAEEIAREEIAREVLHAAYIAAMLKGTTERPDQQTATRAFDAAKAFLRVRKAVRAGDAGAAGA